MFAHLSDRELHLLGQPTRQQVHHLVGWMVLANLLGDVVDDEPATRDELPSMEAARWIGLLGKAASARKGSKRRSYKQQVSSNRTRQVRVRKGKNGVLAS